MDDLARIQTDLQFRQYVEDAKNIAKVALTKQVNEYGEPTTRRTIFDLKNNVKKNSKPEVITAGASNRSYRTLPAVPLKNRNFRENLSSLLAFKDSSKQSIFTGPHDVSDPSQALFMNNQSIDESLCSAPNTIWIPPISDKINGLTSSRNSKSLTRSPSSSGGSEAVVKKINIVQQQQKDDGIRYVANKINKEHNEEIKKIDTQIIFQNAKKFPWPAKTEIFADLIKNMEANTWKKHFKRKQQYFLPIDNMVHEINTKYNGLKLQISHVGTAQIPNVYINCSHWENAAFFHPPMSADAKTVKAWLRNVLGNTYIFGDLILSEREPSTVCTAILMFRPENLLREDDIRQILSNKVNGVSSEDALDTQLLGANATKFPWPWPKDTPIFEIINEDLQLYPWKKHFKETVQFTMDLRKLVTSLKVNYMGRLKIRIEFKTSFRNENTLIPNLYIKTNTWHKAHVLHAPTHSTQKEGEHWLRNVLGNLYLFGHALFVDSPTVDHTAMLLYTLNHRKLADDPKSGSPTSRSFDMLKQMPSLNSPDLPDVGPERRHLQQWSPNSTKAHQLSFQRSRLFKHLTAHDDSRRNNTSRPTPMPLPVPKSNSRELKKNQFLHQFPRKLSPENNQYMPPQYGPKQNNQYMPPQYAPKPSSEGYNVDKKYHRVGGAPFTPQEAANVREFKPRQKSSISPVSRSSSGMHASNYEDMVARYRAQGRRTESYRNNGSEVSPHNYRDASHYHRENSHFDRPRAPRPVFDSSPKPPSSTRRTFAEYAEMRQNYEDNLIYARMYKEMYSGAGSTQNREMYAAPKY